VDPSGPLRLFGRISDADALPWPWVAEQLEHAGTYWVVPHADGHPHPRPVWGIWHDGALLLSVGSPVVARQIAAHAEVTVHLDSGTDVVVVEGHVAGQVSEGPALAAYDKKYDWDYDVDQYGPLTLIEPATVLAWRSGGWAGRDGFQQTGRWQLE
jgi:hypothetical protein